MVMCLENSSSFSLNIIFRRTYVSDTGIITLKASTNSFGNRETT